MTSFQESVLVSFADWDKLGSVPRWAHGFNTQRNTVSEISKADHLPGIIVLKAPTARVHGSRRLRVDSLVERIEQSSHPVKIVLSFPSRKRTGFQGMLDVLNLFPPALSSNIEISPRLETLEDSLNEAFVKYFLFKEDDETDPLASAKNVVNAVRPLLAESGRLSAKAIATEFGMPVAQLAKQIRQSRQAISKTPDAPKIQTLLRPYERIFRLRSIFTKDDFLAWLERPNRELDDSSPMEIIKTGRAEIIADLVEDMLLGAPS
jgi:hypothetical protein